MILLLAALLAGPDPAAAFDARIGASAAAAERLQGPLDGAWVVRDRRGRALLRLQIDDPPQDSRPPSGAWQAADGSAMGPIEAIEATHGVLHIRIAPDDRLVLLRRRGSWRGRMIEAGRASPVTLERKLDRPQGASTPLASQRRPPREVITTP